MRPRTKTKRLFNEPLKSLKRLVLNRLIRQPASARSHAHGLDTSHRVRLYFDPQSSTPRFLPVSRSRC